jgi:hypothetical protein
MQNIQKGAFMLLLSCVSLPLVGQTQGVETPPASTPRPAFGPQTVPAPPPTLEQLPASAPRVAFQGGQLTIVARNASLGAILREVQSQTGATVDMPANPTDRVVGQFGPGPAREVLASLLNGSRFNYVLMGSPQDPTSLDRVVLLKKSSGTDQPGGASQGANTAQMIVPRQGAIVTPNQDEDANAEDAPEETMEADPPAEDQANQGDEQQGGGGQPAVKTPQQLLQELQQQQQLQQQQGQQGGPLGAPPPQQNQNRLQQ